MSRKRFVSGCIALTLSALPYAGYAPIGSAGANTAANSPVEGGAYPLFEEINTHVRPDQFVPAVKAMVGDRYAGVWADTSAAPARIGLAVKDLSAEEGERIRSLLSAEGQSLLLLTAVKYSWKDLEELEAPLITLLRAANTAGEINGYSVRRDRATNLIFVSLRVAPEGLLAQLRAAVPADALDIVVDPRVGIKLRNGSRTDFPPFEGGQEVTLPASTCTSNFLMYRPVTDPVEYFGTSAAHCGRNGDPVKVGSSSVGAVSIIDTTTPIEADAMAFLSAKQRPAWSVSDLREPERLEDN